MFEALDGEVLCAVRSAMADQRHPRPVVLFDSYVIVASELRGGNNRQLDGSGPATEGTLDADVASRLYSVLVGPSGAEQKVVAAYWNGASPQILASTALEWDGETYAVTRCTVGDVLDRLAGADWLHPEWQWAVDGEWATWLDKDLPYAVVGCTPSLAERIQETGIAAPHDRSFEDRFPIRLTFG